MNKKYEYSNPKLKNIARNLRKSMTKEERTNPKILNYSRRRRIAAGSGTDVQSVNKLIKQFEQTKEMMKRMKGGKRGMKFPF